MDLVRGVFFLGFSGESSPTSSASTSSGGGGWWMSSSSLSVPWRPMQHSAHLDFDRKGRMHLSVAVVGWVFVIPMQK